MAPGFALGQEVAGSGVPDAQIRELANRVWHSAGKADCKARDCRILVADFALPNGYTSQLGQQLADEVSKGLAGLPNAPHVIDRSSLRAYMSTERIRNNLLDTDNAERWLGKQLGATAVLRGKTEMVGEQLRIEVELLNCSKEKAAPREDLVLPTATLTGSLEALDVFVQGVKTPSPDPPPGVFKNDEATKPSCGHCPWPDYTPAARNEKMQGFILLDAIVNADGVAESVTILHGLPFGLNESATNAVKQKWRFIPATKDGQTVRMQVQIEVDFRLY